MTEGIESNRRYLEHTQRLSESILWNIEKETYNRFGPQAWTKKGGVPSYLTSNPFTTKRFAQVILGYLRDCLKKNANTPIETTSPLYILDLGAGMGRFAYLFLREFLPIVETIFSKKLNIRYVMTDIVYRNIAFCQQHPHLQEYIKEGILDFAYYHHSDYSKPFTLINSGDILSPHTIHNPLILIANYFFDTIPQDLFRIHNGQLEEGLVTVSVKKNEETDQLSPFDPLLVQHLECSYDYKPIAHPDSYYDVPEFNSLLKTYCQHFDNITFLFPLGAFQSLNYFSELSKKRFILLVGDRGVCTDKQIQEWGEPRLAKHCSFSFDVNYHSIALYLHQKGGCGFLTTFPERIFSVMAGILGGENKHFPETFLAFRIHLDSFEPKDYWKLISLVEDRLDSFPMEYLMKLLKLGNWDPMNFHLFFPFILKQLPNVSDAMKNHLIDVIDNVWEKFYPCSVSEGDFVLNLGVLLYEMSQYHKALLYFQRSLEITGEKAQTFMNMAACYSALKQQNIALKYFNKAKRLTS